MAVVEWLVRAVACVVCVGLMASEAVAAPLGVAAVGEAGRRVDADGPSVWVDACAISVGATPCDQHGIGELPPSPVTIFDRFAAHAAVADGASTRLALAAASRPGAAEAETTLMADVAGMVRQVPEPPALGLLLTGLALAGGRLRRSRVRH